MLSTSGSVPMKRNSLNVWEEWVGHGCVRSKDFYGTRKTHGGIFTSGGDNVKAKLQEGIHYTRTELVVGSGWSCECRPDGSEQRRERSFHLRCEWDSGWTERLPGDGKGRGQKVTRVETQVRALSLCLRTQVGAFCKYKFIDLHRKVSAGLANKG